MIDDPESFASIEGRVNLLTEQKDRGECAALQNDLSIEAHSPFIRYLGRHRISSSKLNHRVQSCRKSVPDTTLTVLPVGSQRRKSHADGSLSGINHGATQIRLELAPVTGHASAAQYDHVGAIFVPESFARRK